MTKVLPTTHRLLSLALFAALSFGACGDEAGRGLGGGGGGGSGGGSGGTGGGSGGTGGGSGGSGGGGGGGGPSTDDWPEANASLEAQVLALVNARRAEGATCGNEYFGPAAPLQVDAILEEAARLHSLDMVERNFFNHVNPDGEDPGDRITALGYEWQAYGENISSGRQTAESVMEGWMSSTGHCRNIMNPNFEEIGIGYYDGRWTQVFGKPW